jgi:hypothetical protein
VIAMQQTSRAIPTGSLPGPSKRITVEPIRLPTHAPPATPVHPREEPERRPAREPVPSR